MLRVTAFAFTLFGVATASYAAGNSPQARPPRVTDMPPVTAFEFDILQKGPPHGDDARLAESLWKQALATCGQRSGYLVEYRDGYKRPQFDSMENARSMHAYATCRLDDAAAAAGAAAAGGQADPAMLNPMGDAQSPDGALIWTRGPARATYEAVAAKMHRTCADARRRILFASFDVGQPDAAGRAGVHARFACKAD
ncbi:hypothetical protein FIV34_18185 [Luteibacter pinisoli]|uniref:DUF4189 domain-containing protein n=1 Tax=Luteibacter pinisoli TaxID=2589080 RepID=A0A4Y5Z8Y8_9GAMM|nr:hypothetical protein [Luteibacter pinisoli]QDE40999.1 hypothetical protein FIV34_18185 [Luteibacter pinisoli]